MCTRSIWIWMLFMKVAIIVSQSSLFNFSSCNDYWLCWINVKWQLWCSKAGCMSELMQWKVDKIHFDKSPLSFGILQLSWGLKFPPASAETFFSAFFRVFHPFLRCKAGDLEEQQPQEYPDLSKWINLSIHWLWSEFYLNCHHHRTVWEIGPRNFKTQLANASIFDLNRELEKGL